MTLGGRRVGRRSRQANSARPTWSGSPSNESDATTLEARLRNERKFGGAGRVHRSDRCWVKRQKEDSTLKPSCLPTTT